MSIKYHQNGIGREYGADGKLTDNWNPSEDYGNEYVNIHIMIKTPSYNIASGFISVVDRDTFFTETSDVLKSFGILEDSGYNVAHNEEKQAYLYIHPQDVSGVIKKNDVKKIAESFNKLKTCSVRWVDLYKTVYIMTDAEYNEYLTTRKADIRKMLFEKSKTPRKDRFYAIMDVSRDIADKIRLHRLGIDDGKCYGGVGQTVDYILECAEELITEGFLIGVDDVRGKFIRSINKTEQKAFKCFTA